MKTAARAQLFGWVFSIAAHVAIGAYIAWSTTVPDLGFDLGIPDEVEFGLTEAVVVNEGASSPAASTETPAGAGSEGAGSGLDGGVPDAGPSDGGADEDAGRRRRRDAGLPVASAGDGPGAGDEGEGAGDEGTSGRGVAFLPAGSQIALRMDVDRVRASPVAPDVAALLAAMPDWRALLEGSGIDPLNDLDRVLVASPNLQRSRLIVAGRARSDQAAIRAAAERMASAHGQTIAWTTSRGAEVAPWHDNDETERVLAIVGPRHFVIARPEDLPRVLAVARNRAAIRDGEGEGEAEHPADALLSMQEGEGLSLEVEGARNFARARPGQRSPIEMMPTRLRLAVSSPADPDTIEVRSVWTYDDEAQAAAAADYWNVRREAASRNLIVTVLGVAPVLGRAQLTPENDAFRGDVDLSAGEMRRVLTLARGFFEDRAAAQVAPPGSLPPTLAPLAPPRPPEPPPR